MNPTNEQELREHIADVLAQYDRSRSTPTGDAVEIEIEASDRLVTYITNHTNAEIARTLDRLELYELCKEVYEKTGWEDVRDFYHENDTFDEETQTFKRNGIFSIVEHKRADYNTPLYTSDYLLEKLAAYSEARDALWDTAIKSHAADTPLKALLKLTIALSEAGELK